MRKEQEIIPAVRGETSSNLAVMVQREVLPMNTGRSKGYDARKDYDAREVLESAGVKFLGPVPDHPTFQYVELPPGWKKLPTENPTWFKLVDDKDRLRASIFFKSGLYERSDGIVLLARFSVQQDYARREKEGAVVAQVTDCGEVIYTTSPIPLPSNDRGEYSIYCLADQFAINWLDQHHPHWRNPGAYWD